MKKLNKLAFAALMTASAFTSCTDLDERLYSVISQDNYGKTTEEINSLIGPAYGTLVGWIYNDFWMQEITTDEYMIPARGLDWYSGGIHLRYHRHEWSAEECPNMWRFGEVTTINKTLDLLDKTTIEIPNKERIVAELRGLRALWYFTMLDGIGSVPIVTKYEEGLPTNKDVTRKDVYDFVEKELLDIKDILNEDVTTATYGKFTKWACYTLLAKLYINAEVYTGTPEWQKALDCCNIVVNSNKYILEPDVNTNFKIKNEGSKENILVVPYDYNYFRGYFIPYQMSWHYSSRSSFDLLSDCWNGPCAVPGFVHKYDDADVRKKWFMYGQQYSSTGEKLKDRNGNDLNLTIDMGNFENATEVEGARLFKWEPEKGGRNHLNNDFAIFRYADIVLMKAECLLRLNPSNEPNARELVNTLRSRNFNPWTEDKAIKKLTLENLLDERGFEFVFEGWRRNDQIRFGTFGDTWDFKPFKDPADKHTWVFPIPLAEKQKNPNLVQNAGY